jgi:hypothetical protein
LFLGASREALAYRLCLILLVALDSWIVPRTKAAHTQRTRDLVKRVQ